MLRPTQTAGRVSPVVLCGAILGAFHSMTPAVAAQPAASAEAQAAPPANPRDLSGYWERVSPFQSFGAVTGGANEFMAEIMAAQLQGRKPVLSQETVRTKGLPYKDPVFTPAGQAAFEKNFPGYGRRMSDNNRNDPAAMCDPLGVPRMLTGHAGGGLGSWEIVQLPNRMVWFATYHHNFRVVWTDGRKLPSPDDDQYYPMWNGFSVGHWEGNTFVVNSMGFNEKSWLDHNGYPHTENMKLEERYRLLDADTLELRMTLIDPEYYAEPFESDVKIWKRNSERANDWDPQVFCVPSEEMNFNRLIRDGGVGGR